MADAYSDVHYRAIRLAITNSLLGQVLLAGGLLTADTRKRFAVFTFGGVLATGALFLLADQAGQWPGLWQRLGFVLMYAWLWCARLELGQVRRLSCTTKAR
jgi:hypothetical protein